MNILIVGLGIAGAGFGSTESDNHAALSVRYGLKIIGGIDPNQEKKYAFASNFKAPTFDKLEDTVHLLPDVIAIAADAESHISLIKKSIAIFPEAVLICEKPFGNSYQESMIALREIQRAPKKIMVNYSRQFSDGYQELVSNLKGNLVNGTILYNYGIARSCSHYLRLCIGLFGAPRNVKVTPKLGSADDNPSFSLVYENNSRIDFIGVEDSSVRIAEFYLTTELHFLTINQASYWKIIEMKEHESPYWEREFPEVKCGSLTGGLEKLYERLTYGKIDFFSLDATLDALPNSIIERVLSSD